MQAYPKLVSDLEIMVDWNETLELLPGFECFEERPLDLPVCLLFIVPSFCSFFFFPSWHDRNYFLTPYVIPKWFLKNIQQGIEPQWVNFAKVVVIMFF